MSDPAVDAALRQLKEQFGTQWTPTAGEDGRPFYTVRVRTEAAREALKPLRELHYSVRDCIGLRICPECTCRDSQVMWPCATARLIYTTEELA